MGCIPFSIVLLHVILEVLDSHSKQLTRDVHTIVITLHVNIVYMWHSP